ncbi:MAG: hypothetical protein ACTSU0_03520 [Alphaproteobacteria bacterium]
MSTSEAMEAAVAKISRLIGDEASTETRNAVLAAVEEAMATAIRFNCAQNSMVVESMLHRQADMARRINEESVRRRELLISNLSAMR